MKLAIPTQWPARWSDRWLWLLLVGVIHVLLLLWLLTMDSSLTADKPKQGRRIEVWLSADNGAAQPTTNPSQTQAVEPRDLASKRVEKIEKIEKKGAEAAQATAPPSTSNTALRVTFEQAAPITSAEVMPQTAASAAEREPAPAKLRLDQATVQSAIKDAEQQGVHGMASRAGRALDAEAEKQSKLGKAIAAASVVSSGQAQSNARMDALKNAACKDARSTSSAEAQGAFGMAALSTDTRMPFTVSNPNDCKKDMK